MIKILGARILLFMIFFVIKVSFLYAQSSNIKGRILDTNTKLPLSGVNISVLNSNIITVTNEYGYFSIKTDLNVDSIFVAAPGYISKKVAINKRFILKSNVIFLEQVSHTLDEIIVKPSKRNVKEIDPAVKLFKKIIAHKDKNNPERHQALQYAKYNKIELDILGKTIKKNKIINKKFPHILNYLESSKITGDTYLPVILIENLSDVYISKVNPSFNKEIIKASKTSGVGDNSSYNSGISQFTNKLYQQVNIYDNYIILFEKGFVSPIAKTGLGFYKYYITDSLYQNGIKSYQLSFRPLRKEDPAFIGEMWIEDSTFAVQKIKMHITGEVNLNWIKNVIIEDDFQQINDNMWFWKKQYFFIEFSLKDNIFKKSPGFLSHSTTEFNDVQIDPKFQNDLIFAHSKDLVVNEDAFKKNDKYWEINRPSLLSKKEENIYQMLDSLNKIPLYITLENVFEVLLTGYLEVGKFDIGPLYSFISFNSLEDYKVSFGGKTNEKFSRKIRFKGYLNYGFKNKELKYRTGLRYILNKENDLRKQLDINVKKDVRQLGKSADLFSENNIFFSLLARRPTNKLTYYDEYGLNYFHQWSRSFSNSFKITHKKFGATDSVRFQYTNNFGGNETFSDKTTEFSINFRWSKGEEIVESNFSRYHLNTYKPVINLNLLMGSKFLGGNYDYFKIRTTFYHNAMLNPIGRMEYILIAEKIFGKIPFLYLKIHEGNETYVHTPYAYNLMNYYEFASDKYASIYVEHHFDGFLFNKIPLLRNTKWRTLLSGKILWGDLRDENNGTFEDSNAIFNFPLEMKQLDKPYIELGVGIENIFKVVRVDAVWRLSYLENDYNKTIDKFGIRGMIQLNF